MPFREFLHTYYAIPVEEKLVLAGKEGYKHGEYFYFIINVNNKEIIHMEQAALAYYLAENGFNNMAIPIQNIHGDWFTIEQEKSYIVLQAQHPKWEQPLLTGEALASFHQAGSSYNYEPNKISSYGQWKVLWIDKLTVFETHLEQEAKKHPDPYYQLVMDVLPYIIGISENAIQYLQESERDQRFHEADQGTISFRRYTDQLVKPVLWADDLVYDHPARDLAECIRFMLLENDNQENVIAFLNGYQRIRPLSVFSWRLIYARLLFPVPFFDLIQRGFLTDSFDELFIEMTALLDQQANYEKKLKKFYQMAGVEYEKLNIPVLEWL